MAIIQTPIELGGLRGELGRRINFESVLFDTRAMRTRISQLHISQPTNAPAQIAEIAEYALAAYGPDLLYVLSQIMGDRTLLSGPIASCFGVRKPGDYHRTMDYPRLQSLSSAIVREAMDAKLTGVDVRTAFFKTSHLGAESIKTFESYDEDFWVSIADIIIMVTMYRMADRGWFVASAPLQTVRSLQDWIPSSSTLQTSYMAHVLEQALKDPVVVESKISEASRPTIAAITDDLVQSVHSVGRNLARRYTHIDDFEKVLAELRRYYLSSESSVQDRDGTFINEAFRLEELARDFTLFNVAMTLDNEVMVNTAPVFHAEAIGKRFLEWLESSKRFQPVSLDSLVAMIDVYAQVDPRKNEIAVMATHVRREIPEAVQAYYPVALDSRTESISLVMDPKVSTELSKAGAAYAKIQDTMALPESCANAALSLDLLGEESPINRGVMLIHDSDAIFVALSAIHFSDTFVCAADQHQVPNGKKTSKVLRRASELADQYPAFGHLAYYLPRTDRRWLGQDMTSLNDVYYTVDPYSAFGYMINLNNDHQHRSSGRYKVAGDALPVFADNAALINYTIATRPFSDDSLSLTARLGQDTVRLRTSLPRLYSSTSASKLCIAVDRVAMKDNIRLYDYLTYLDDVVKEDYARYSNEYLSRKDTSPDTMMSDSAFLRAYHPEMVRVMHRLGRLLMDAVDTAGTLPESLYEQFIRDTIESDVDHGTLTIRDAKSARFKTIVKLYMSLLIFMTVHGVERDTITGIWDLLLKADTPAQLTSEL